MQMREGSAPRDLALLEATTAGFQDNRNLSTGYLLTQRMSHNVV